MAARMSSYELRMTCDVPKNNGKIVPVDGKSELFKESFKAENSFRETPDSVISNAGEKSDKLQPANVPERFPPIVEMTKYPLSDN